MTKMSIVKMEKILVKTTHARKSFTFNLIKNPLYYTINYAQS